MKTINLVHYLNVIFWHNLRKAIRIIFEGARNVDRNSQQNLGHILVLTKAAKALNIQVEELSFDLYELRYNNLVRRIGKDMRNDLDNAVAYWVTGHKFATLKILEKNGINFLPYSQLYSFQTIDLARQEFFHRKKISVVKPCYGTSSGKGVTVGISTLKDLNRAINNALLYDSSFLLEDFIEGDNFRLLFLFGEMISAIKRIPASVIGNGRSTISELILQENVKRENSDPDKALWPISLDNEVIQKLKNNGLSLKAVPPRGELISLKSVANFNAGGTTEEISTMVHSEIIKECRNVANILQVNLAGIDLITQDISRPLSETGGVINEVNTSPGIEMHYKVTNQGERKDVGGKILKGMFNIT